MDFAPSPRGREMLERLQAFMAEHVLPADASYREANHRLNGGSDWTRWQTVPLVEDLKEKARAAGLWNLFLPDPELGAGLKTVEYAPLAEAMGHSQFAAEVFNCNAPTPATWRCCTTTAAKIKRPAGWRRCCAARSARCSA